MRNQLKQREVAAAIGIKPSTYGNVESSAVKVIRRDRAETLARFFKLSTADRDRLLEAWEQTPLSEYGERVRERWKKHNESRSKTRHYDVLKLALVEALALVITRTRNPNELCLCVFGGGTAADPTRPCELCSGLHALGLDGWTTEERVIVSLSKLQDKLEAEILSKGQPLGKA